MNEQWDTIIYHAIAPGVPCLDGFGAAWAAWLYNKNIKAIGVQYDDAPPDVTGLRVLICDVTFQRDILEKMKSVAKDLIVIDHHASAERLLKDLPYAHFDMTKSGAMLMFKFFYPEANVPPLIKYVQDSDLWKFDLPSSREIRAWLPTVGYTLEKWEAADTMLLTHFDEVVQEGAAILRAQNVEVERLAATATTVLTGAGAFGLVNSGCYQSEIGSFLADRFIVTCIYSIGADYVNLSFRTKHDDIDVSILAKTFGGGGHKKSAGAKMQFDAEKSTDNIIAMIMRRLQYGSVDAKYSKEV